MKILNLKEEIKVAVIMPAYKQAEYVAEALDSLLAQTYSNWECAVVDDGSPDDVRSIVELYARRDERIRFHHTENHGVSAARNFAVSATTAPLILPLDADDRLAPEYIAECVKAFRKHPDATVVFADWKFFGKTTYTPRLEYTGFRDLLTSNSIHCSGMFWREDFERIGGYDESIPFGYEDWEFWIRLLAPKNLLAENTLSNDTGKVIKLHRPLFYYRIKPKSRSTDIDRKHERKEECFRYIFRKHVELFIIFFPDMLTIINDYSDLQRRLTKWRRRPLLSRLWHALIRRL